MKNNLNLQRNRIDIEASAFSERNLWSELFPAISASASVGFISPLASGSGFQLNEDTRRYSVGAGINLGLNAGIPHSIRNIRLAHQANLLRYEDAANQLSILITKKFYSLIAEKNNLLLLEEILALAQMQYARNEISFRNGLIRELVLIQSRLAVGNARYVLSAANTAFANSMGEFLAMLGLDSGLNTVLLGEINIVKIDACAGKLIDMYLDTRPDIVRARQEIERLQNLERTIVMQNRAPSLSLRAEWGSSRFDPFTDSLSGSANVTIPIDPWITGSGRNQSMRNANDAVKRAKLDLAMIKDAAKTQIRSLSALLRNSWDGIIIARLGVEVAELNYQMTEYAFRNGTVESLVLEDARNNMANSRHRLLQTELSYLNLILDLCAAINVDREIIIQTYGVSDE